MRKRHQMRLFLGTWKHFVSFQFVENSNRFPTNFLCNEWNCAVLKVRTRYSAQFHFPSYLPPLVVVGVFVVVVVVTVWCCEWPQNTCWLVNARYSPVKPSNSCMNLSHNLKYICLWHSWHSTERSTNYSNDNGKGIGNSNKQKPGHHSCAIGILNNFYEWV